MTLQFIFSKQYLFNPTPTTESRLYIPLLIVFGLMVLLSIGWAFQKDETKKLTRSFFYLLTTIGILGLLYLFSRYEGMPWLGSRLFLAIILVSFFVWLLVNVIRLIKFYPRYSKQKEVEERYNKYLPKAKPKRK